MFTVEEGGAFMGDGMEVCIKWCSMCKQWRGIGEFYAGSGRVDGLHHRCKRCDAWRKRMRLLKKKVSGHRWACQSGLADFPPGLAGFIATAEQRDALLGGKLKMCAECKQFRFAECYSLNVGKKSQGGLCRVCKACANERSKKCSKKCRGRTLGVSEKQRDCMVAAQDGLCAICGRPPTVNNVDGVARLGIDHEHGSRKDGWVRGLLCNGCNFAIGAVKDDTRVMEHAIAYLRRFGFMRRIEATQYMSDWQVSARHVLGVDCVLEPVR